MLAVFAAFLEFVHGSTEAFNGINRHKIADSSGVKSRNFRGRNEMVNRLL